MAIFGSTKRKKQDRKHQRESGKPYDSGERPGRNATVSLWLDTKVAPRSASVKHWRFGLREVRQDKDNPLADSKIYRTLPLDQFADAVEAMADGAEKILEHVALSERARRVVLAYRDYLLDAKAHVDRVCNESPRHPNGEDSVQTQK